jgi:hypothetical protein
MNEPKIAVAGADAERLVRELLDAFKSLKAIPPPPTCSSPGKDEQQPSAGSEEASERAFETETASEPVGKVPATSSAEPEPVTTTLFEALTEARTVQHEIIEEFRRDHEVIERLGVTLQELQALFHASPLGSLTCRQDVLFMLRRIREASNPAEPQAAVPPEPLHIPAKNIESSMPDVREMTERIRREAMAKLTESDSLRGIDHRRTPRHFGVFSSALVLMAGITGGCIRTVSNWRYHLSPKPALPAQWFIERVARFSKAGGYKVLVSALILLVASVVIAAYFGRGRFLTYHGGRT